MRKTVTLFALCALLLGVPAYANFGPTGFSTLPGATIGGVAAGGTATFSLTGSTLTIALTNTGDVVDIAHLLTGVGWSFIGGSGLTITDPTLTSTLIGYTCTGTGAGTACSSPKLLSNTDPGGGLPTEVVQPWKSNAGTGTLGNSAFDISSFTGTPKGSSVANNTITADGHDGLSTDQPYLQGIAAHPTIFTLTVNGSTAGITGVTDVVLAFGTAGGVLVTPEPGFYGAIALGLSGLLFVRRRQRKEVL